MNSMKQLARLALTMTVVLTLALVSETRGQSAPFKPSATEAATCYACHGSGKGICGMCNGTGKGNCLECVLPPPYGVCKACRGTKQVPCVLCGANGASCSVCHGHGRTIRRFTDDEIENQRQSWRSGVFSSAENALNDGNPKFALAEYKLLLAEFPSDPRAMNGSGLAYWHLGNRKQARKIWQGMLQSDPKGILAPVNLAWADIQERKSKSAIPYLQRALKIAPSDGDALYWLAFAYTDLKQAGQACKVLRRYIYDADGDGRFVCYNPDFDRIRKTEPFRKLMADSFGVAYRKGRDYVACRDCAGDGRVGRLLPEVCHPCGGRGLVAK